MGLPAFHPTAETRQILLSIYGPAHSSGIDPWVGGLLESGIGRAHNLALASLPGFTLPGDVSESARYYARDVIEPPVTMERDGTVELPTAPGLGFEVLGERLIEYSERTLTLTA